MTSTLGDQRRIRVLWKRRPAAICGLIIVAALNAMSVVRAESPARMKTGHAFREVLQTAVNVVRPQTEVRDIFGRLASLYEISVLLDRRVDPNRLIDVQLSQLTLLDGLKLLAAQIDADAAVIGSTVMIGPPESLDRMRTDIALQYERLKSAQDDAVRERNFARLQGYAFRWDDLTTPAELLQQIADEFDLSVAGLELVPHDLWAGGVMADVNAVEALAIVASQFDLTFSWTDDFSGIALEPSPRRLVIERIHTGSRADIEAVLQTSDEFPQATLERQEHQLRVLGTIGEHERIARLLKGDDASDDTPAPDSAPLRRRRFTITTRPVPVIAVLRHLETQDVIVEYNPQELHDAGIDLSHKIELSLTEATAEEFFRALCDPVGLAFEIDGKTVRLSPARPSP